MGLPSMHRFGLTHRSRSVSVPGLVRPYTVWPSSYWFFNAVVDPSTCVAAYQPILALDYTSSKINLANPGVQNATDVNGGCNWDAATGWAFESGDVTGKVYGAAVNTGYTIITRFSDGVASNDGALWGISGIVGANPSYVFPKRTSTDVVRYTKHNTSVDKAPGMTGGVIAVAGTLAYRDGVDEGITLVNTMLNASLGIGYRTQGTPTTVQSQWTGKIQALAIYSTALTAQEVADLTTAMAAL